MIVCEDSVLTNTYLGKIREVAIAKEVWSKIDIFPIPPDDDVTTVKNNIPEKSKRKKRSFKNVEIDPQFELESEYKAVPTRYVREVQIRMEESGYDEGWAVYDRNGHPKQAEAYQLSLTEPKVNLAFSSVSVEHFFLLHFVRDNTAYNKSQDVPLGNYIGQYEKTSEGAKRLYELTIELIDIALENTAWLRTLNSNREEPCYKINPYVDMDLLIKSLFGIEEVIIWGWLNDVTYLNRIIFEVRRADNEVVLNISNNSTISFAGKALKIYATDLSRKKIDFGHGAFILEPGKKVQLGFSFPGTGLFNILYGHYRAVIEI